MAGPLKIFLLRFVPCRCELIITKDLWGPGVSPTKFPYSLATSSVRTEVAQTTSHHGKHLSFAVRLCMSVHHLTSTGLISALERITFGLTPKSAPVEPLCWVTFCWICLEQPYLGGNPENPGSGLVLLTPAHISL